MTDNHTTIFEAASRVFEGWTDDETGLQILKVAVKERDVSPRTDHNTTWRTEYHQARCFLDGGRKVLLRGYPVKAEFQTETWRAQYRHVIDLTTGEVSYPFPEGKFPWEVCDATGLAILSDHSYRDAPVTLWDLRAQQAVAEFHLPGWQMAEGKFLSDGQRAVVAYYQGQYYDEPCNARLYLLSSDGDGRQIGEVAGHMCNHIMDCPTDPELFAYDRWPCPRRRTEVIIHIRNVNGTFETPLPQLEDSVRPGSVWGGQRDHYLWSADGTRILSYVFPGDPVSENHYDWEWWLSVLDWRSGEDVCLPYPPQRWGGNFAQTPDSRYIVSATDEKLHYLYAIDVAALRDGWNERKICSYPAASLEAINASVRHHPHVLPDGSGVILTAGYPGANEGVYLAEWPRD